MNDAPEEIFERLYKDVDGFSTSMQNRKELDLMLKELTYGEIEFESFRTILRVIKPKGNEVFYDLGCGTGKAVVTAALVSPWKKLVGVELLKDVYDIAVNVGENLDNDVLEFIHGDITDVDFSDGDVVFIASTCFDDSFMNRLASECEKLKSGSRVITLSKKLSSPMLKDTYKFSLPMSWGSTTVYIHEKR